ncbi:BofC C-terminal domain-containing protein [Cohnella caldifontis]|uniref:BofC C-terminal domain-containing protein n=1 Tax=Cohnella caldifontis TaxID=3027471 RepID=UPI0023EB84B6|nr:BofC C-terminal domain-containing protein [Cohnella sp. YIM B05605]
MFVFRALKELKKKLKRRRRPVLSLGMLAAVFTAASASGVGTAVLIQKAILHGDAKPVVQPVADSPYAFLTSEGTGQAPETASDAVIQALARWDGEVEIVLHRVYWCGEERRLLGRRSAPEAAKLLRSHREWSAAFDSDGRLVLEETSHDPSPACRKTAYIGMDTDGNLSLFDGPPRKDNVVRTFFQLDVRTLESSVSKERLHELASGIKVTDRDEYDSVLSAFSDYAARKSAGVMKSVP